MAPAPLLRVSIRWFSSPSEQQRGLHGVLRTLRRAGGHASGTPARSGGRPQADVGTDAARRGEAGRDSPLAPRSNHSPLTLTRSRSLIEEPKRTCPGRSSEAVTLSRDPESKDVEAVAVLDCASDQGVPSG